MCGIFGIFTRQQVDPAVFASLGEANTRRGNLAFGVLTVSEAGQQIMRHAGGFDPQKVNLTGVHRLLGHIRAPTDSRTNNPREIHPFATKDFWLAHNGLLLNHTAFPQWRLEPDLQVDSLVIAGGIQHHLDAGFTMPEAISQTAEALEGQQACWLWTQTGKLYLWRVMSPVYYDGGGQFIFSSVKTSAASILIDEGVIYRFDPDHFTLEPLRTFVYHNPYKI